MSSLGRTLSQIKKFGEIKQKSIKELDFPIGIKTPLREGKREGESLFEMNFTAEDQIKDNLRNLIMTQKGERLGFPDFGTNLYRLYSSSILEIDQIEEILMTEIKDCVQKYMPSISLEEFYSNKIEEGVKNQDFAGNDFSNKLKQVSINNVESSKNIKKDVTDNTVYEINIKYNIPSIESKNELLTIYVKSSR